MANEIIIIYPSVFGEMSSPWKEEYDIAKGIGLNVTIFEEDTLEIKTDLSNKIIIYRGWMISEETYSNLIKKVEYKKGKMLIPLEQFRKANNFSSWYNILNRYTMESHYIKDFKDLDNYFKDNKSWFVKDNLKSLGEKRSIANSKEEAIEIYNEIQKNRDFELKENGMCLREITEITDEERFFAFNGKILGTHKDKNKLKLAEQVIDKLYNKLGLLFISIDIGNSNMKSILIEVGGFQVSDMSKNGDNMEIIKCYINIKEELEKVI